MDWLEVKNIKRNAPSEDLENREPTSARNKKHYWCKPLADNVSMLDIEMSELVDSDDVKDMSGEKKLDMW